MTKTRQSKVNQYKRLMHKNHRRFKSGMKVILFLVICFLATLYLIPEYWKIVLGVLVFFTLTTSLEYWGYKKHKASLRKLGHDT
jgi:glucan phosphoethanolaminetransferase (alkaline phosphatase superfamily)